MKSTVKHLYKFLLLFILVLSLISCKKDPESAPNTSIPTSETTTESESLSITPESSEDTVPDEAEPLYDPKLNADILSLRVEETTQLTLTGIPDDAQIQWITSDPKIAIVNESGEVTGVGIGTATITAIWIHNDETFNIPAEVTVSKAGIPISEFTIDNFYIGETRKISAVTTSEDVKVTYKSSDKKVVTVKKDGTITAVGKGKAQITVTSGTYTGKFTVIVTKPSVALSHKNCSLYIEDTTELKAEIKPDKLKVKWSSEDPNVATVENGKIKAVSAGTTKIRAKISYKDKSYSKTCTVTVTEPNVTFTSESFSLVPGESRNLSVNTVPGGLTVTYSSNNTSVATVNGTQVTAIAPGNATITAQVTYNGKKYDSTCTIKVVTPSISLSAESMKLAIGESKKLSAETTPDNCAVSWSSNNPSIATVSGGTITGVSSGNATITAKITISGKNYTASCKVTVKEPTITVTSSSSNITYAERKEDRGTCTLTADVSPKGGKITWKSSDKSIATVKGNGNTATVTAISSGSVTITATYSVGGRTLTDSCTIQVSKAASTLTCVLYDYPAKGSLYEFYLNGYISSNYALDRIELYGTATSNALGIPISDSPAPWYFPDNTYYSDTDDSFKEYCISLYKDMYNTYVAIADFLGADHSVTMNVTATIYDKSGASYSITITYVLDE